MAGDKLNIQFRISAVDAFSATMAKLDAKLAALRKYGDDSIKVAVKADFDDNGAIAQMKAFQKAAKALGNTKVKVEFNSKGYEKVMAEFAAYKKAIPRNKTVTTTLKTKDDFSKPLGKLKRDLGDIEKRVKRLGNKKVKVNVDSNAGGLGDTSRDLNEINDRLNDIDRNTRRRRSIDIDIDRNPFQNFWNDFQKTMSRIANVSRNVGEIFQHYFVGAIVQSLPMAVPVIASVGGALGALLPIIGTLGGGIMGLGTAFAMAGAGGLAYAGLMKSVLGEVFEASEDLAELQEDLSLAKDEKERVKILEKIADIQARLTEEQQRAVGSLGALKMQWQQISSALEPQIVTTFGTAMQTATNVLVKAAPMFESVAKHADNLMNWLSQQIEADDMKAFFEFLNTSAGPALETVGKALSNFAIGILNMLTAFGPMSVDMQNGFLGMSESFRAWTASLKESERFNAFVDYVKENLPKLGKIFGDLILGLVGMGEAFAPFAADMLTGLQDMMERFKEWGQTLKNNEGFKEFIAYVTENGPKVLDFFGTFRDLIINVGKMFSSVGVALLEFNTWIMDIINSMLEANDTFTKIIGWILALGAMIATQIPTMVLFRTAIKHIGPIVMAVIGFIGRFLPALGKIGTTILRVLPNITKIGLFIGRLAGPIGLIITTVIQLAVIIYQNWDKITAWTTNMVNKMAATFATMSAKAKTAFNAFKNIIKSVMGSINLYESGKKIVKGLINGITSMIGAAGKAIGRVAEKVRGFLPFSPAKEGPLRDINKLNFAGPITDSIYGDQAAIAKAMGSVLAVPDIKAGTVAEGVYAARSQGFGSDKVSNGVNDLVQMLTDGERQGDIVLEVDGYELARVQRKHNDQLQGSRMNVLSAVRGT